MKILLLFLLNLALNASSFTNVWIAKDKEGINFENITNFKDFTKTSLPIKKFNSKDTFWIRLDVNESLLNQNIPHVLKIETELGRNYIEYNTKYPKDIQEVNLFHLEQSDNISYYFKLNNFTNSIYFDAEIKLAKTYYQIKSIRKTLYGIAYGIILSAVLYYFAFYIFNRQKNYIYYSLTQFFMLLMLIIVTSKSSSSDDEFIFAILYSNFIIFTSLFTSSFLKLKQHAPIWNKILILNTLILIIDAFTNIFTLLHIPIAQLMFVYIIMASIVYYRTSQVYILFYIAGWGILISSFVFIELQVIFFNKYLLQLNDILHIAMPIESLILAFALSYKMQLIENERTIKERMLIHYDKRASIGDMIDNITHQWRQPLTHIGYLIMNISAAIRNDKLNLKYWQKKEKEINLQLEYMSQTITDFRDFYKQTSKNSKFNLYDCISKTYQIVKPTLLLHEIQFSQIGKKDIFIAGNESEFSQVILNFINNSKEAFEKNDINDKKITITISHDSLSVEDNAGGIDNTIQENLFQAYVSTKAECGGIGLYMSKLIIEKHFHSKLHYKNTLDGTLFWITFNTGTVKTL